MAHDLILSHDGAVDDMVALALATTFQHRRLVAVLVTDADCHAHAAARASRKLLRVAGLGEVPVAVSRARSVNSFPEAWRLDSLRIEQFPMLASGADDNAPFADAVDLLASRLRSAPAPIEVLELGPLSTLAMFVERHADLVSRIQRVVWMGGALSVAGNVAQRDAPGHDGSAEWNAYWDPAAVRTVLASGIPLVLCPLDLTDTVPVSPTLIQALAAARERPLIDFAGQCYALVAYRHYTVWDMLTCAYVGWPELFKRERRCIDVVTDGPSQGRIRTAENGTPVDVLANVDQAAFWLRLIEALKMGAASYA